MGLNVLGYHFHVRILPVVSKDLPLSPRCSPYDFLSRCKFSTLTTRQPMVEILLDKNRTLDFRTKYYHGKLRLNLLGTTRNWA